MRSAANDGATKMDLIPDLIPPRHIGTLPAFASTAELVVSPGRLNGSKPPHHELVEEKPWHRAAAVMFAAGSVTVREVASAFEVSPPNVSNLLRQPWFQERVNSLMAEHGGKDIIALFKAEQFNSLVTLVELRDNEKISPTVRKDCARDILDRALGKPIQRVETTDVPRSDDPVAEVERLELENRRRREELGG